MIKILHIEDEIDIQEVTRMALEDVGGFSVVVASSGKEGLSMRQVIPRRPSDGNQLCKRIATRLSRLHLNSVEHLLGTINDQVVESGDDRCPV